MGTILRLERFGKNRAASAIFTDPSMASLMFNKCKFFVAATLWIITFAATSLTAKSVSAEDLVGPTAKDQNVAKIVAVLLKGRHISREGLNDQLSQRALELFLKTLDPMKLYFYQSDIDEFRKYEFSIDDMIPKGDLNAGYMIFKRFLQRMDERVATAEKLLDGEFDFTIDESIVVDPDAARYPANEQEANERWRRQIKYRLLVAKDEAEDLRKKALEEGKEPPAADDAKAKLARRYQRNKKRWHETETDDLLEYFLTAVTTSYDPHTTFMSPKSLEKLPDHHATQP